MLTAPAHLRGRMSKHTDPAIIAERSAWALQAGRDGWSSYAVADALGISQFAAYTIMAKAGWQWWKQDGDRIIRHPNSPSNWDKDDMRAKKSNYEFHKKRHGGQMIVNTDQERRYVMSAFANWKRRHPGEFTAGSVKIGDEFVITFSGISPAEANEARIAAVGDI